LPSFAKRWTRSAWTACPAVGDANHVAVGLLAHFLDSADAADLCYDAQIGKNRCRPLAASSRKPLPLARND
jgi:hypothetical protein